MEEMTFCDFVAKDNVTNGRCRIRTVSAIPRTFPRQNPKDTGDPGFEDWCMLLLRQNSDQYGMPVRQIGAAAPAPAPEHGMPEQQRSLQG